ncbi:hypothetical protein [Qipengyuania sp. NPDC077563]|uniref:hypothetical protein n=1 Tax=Qipengyuania sp. NPDC077563 TaxID=3364497 RepID=UPI00384D45D4
MNPSFDVLTRRIAEDGRVSADELLELRRSAWPDGVISKDEAEAIFALNRQLTERGPDWTDFFVEAIGEFVVNQIAPKGYVDDANAAWLMAQVDADGELGSMAELETLVRIFEIAKNVPQALKDYAIRQMETAVVEGTGPTRRGGDLEAGNVNATEARLLRRAIFAPASDRPAGVSQSEAEMLFRIKNVTLTADNAPEWKQLFVQGVASYVEGFATEAAQLDREKAIELERFMNDTSSSVGGFLMRMFGTLPDNEGLRQARDGSIGVFADREADAATGKVITKAEQAWLDRKIDQDGKVDEYEQALLDFLAEG